jgi:hypothetical protein
MAEFVKGYDLNARLEMIFEKAENQLIIISPFIKLHSKIKDILKSRKSNDKLKITIVFGKNEGNISKSVDIHELEFFKEFPNIEIYYEPRLHAKYYSNESMAMLSSMNLYDYSQDNNIEFGIVTKTTLIGDIKGILTGDHVDKQAMEYFHDVINNSKALYIKTPVYEDKLMGLYHKYINSKITLDELSSHYRIKSSRSKTKNITKKEPEQSGYCIRTGDKIPFNIDMPMSNSAFQTWSNFKDENYPEKFCHFSGERSNRKTSFAKPILNKHWNKAMKKQV